MSTIHIFLHILIKPWICNMVNKAQEHILGDSIHTQVA